MYKPTVIELISESPSAAGILETRTEARKRLCCMVTSVGMREAYEAKSAGFSPELRFLISVAKDYDNQRRIEHNGTVYRVVRVYQTDEDSIELTVERWDSDV